MASSSTNPQRLDAFVSFPSPYTQSLIVSALVKLVPSLSLSLIPPQEDNPPRLQWADYDLMTYDIPHSNPSKYQTSSYVYRKALIRKHQLHTTFLEYLAKSRHRGIKTILEEAAPKGWTVEIRFADELDEALVDELGELRVALEANEGLDERDRQWYILKPGFADRAQGIRLFSTEQELQAIFEEFEEGSSDEEEDEDEEELADKTRAVELDDDEEENGTGVLTSQLRHFVIQEYLARPVLFDIAQTYGTPSTGLEGSKFHLRAYVLITGGYTVHLSRAMLALFSGSPYTRPTSSSSSKLDLAPHLTNTCLQTDAYGAPAPPEELVKLFWELEGLDALSTEGEGYESRGKIDRKWLDETFKKVGEVVAESVKAGAECGSFGLQLVPNAFEVFGVDLLLNFPEMVSGSTVSIPKVTILEYNASPDFHQSGERLRPHLAELFQGIVRISVAPFFGLVLDDEQEETGGWEVGTEKWGWRLVGQGQVFSSGIQPNTKPSFMEPPSPPSMSSSKEPPSLPSMSSLMEPPSPPNVARPLPRNDRASPISTYHLSRPIAGVSTDLLIQSFDDRILVVITQNQKIGILTQASIPHVTQLPHPPPAESTASTGIPNLPPPPPGLTLTPLLGSPRPDEQALYDLYVSQVSTLIWWTLNELGSLRRPVVVGLALAESMAGEDDEDEVERKRFGEILKMVIEWPGPQY